MNKKILNNSLNVILGMVLIYLVYFNFFADSCGKVLTYKIGEVDSRFNLSRADAVKYAGQAAELWNDGLNQNVLVYDEKGDIEINFVYDERQRTTIQNKILKAKAEDQIDVLDEKGKTIEIQKSNFQSEKGKYEASVKEFNTRLSSYNSTVQAVNARGGATQEEASGLNNEKAYLQAKASELESARKSLNSYLSSINENVDDYNDLGHAVNNVIEKINENSGREFEEGVYSNNKITLYEYEDINVLKRLMAHELGHALYLDHVDNVDSIMYYLNESKSFKLSKEDVAEYNRVCKITK